MVPGGYEISRHLGVKHDTAWLPHNKILRAMHEEEDDFHSGGRIVVKADHQIEYKITLLAQSVPSRSVSEPERTCLMPRFAVRWQSLQSAAFWLDLHDAGKPQDEPQWCRPRLQR
jgi:hypothetical protein